MCTLIMYPDKGSVMRWNVMALLPLTKLYYRGFNVMTAWGLMLQPNKKPVRQKQETKWKNNVSKGYKIDTTWMQLLAMIDEVLIIAVKKRTYTLIKQ